MITVGSCFSGIGGLELGLERTGKFKTKWQIEQDEYASKVLAKHWPDVKRYRDIRDVVRPQAVDLIAGGFPCQDVSIAGKRAGLEGKRTTLWSEMLRLVREVKPRWVLAENVPGLLSIDDGRFFGNILRDLAESGYSCQWQVLSARQFGANHLRRRVFILADAGLEPTGIDRSGLDRGTIGKEEGVGTTAGDKPRDGDQILADGSREGQPRRSRWWSVEPNVGRVAYGVPARVDRLRCLGNAVVPQVAEAIGEMILRSC